MEENKSQEQKTFTFHNLPTSQHQKPIAQSRFPDMLLSHSPDFQLYDMSPWSASQMDNATYNPDLKQIENLIHDSDSPILNKGFNPPPNLGSYFPYDDNNEYEYEYDSEPDNNVPFSTDFPRAFSYGSLDSIIQTFPHLTNINNSGFDINKVSSDAHFYLMRSSNDDNIHKAIKYHIWTTTAQGKQILNKAWNSFKERGVEPEIYLIFSVVESNHFLGIAKLASTIDDNYTFKYWWESCKWFGTFQVDWLFVKDIHYSYFEHFKQEISDNPRHFSSVVNLRDTTRINYDTGKKILEIFLKHANVPNIFASFAFMDRREDFMREQRDNDPEFLKFFEESCTYYKQNPEKFRPQTNQNYHRKDFKKNPNQKQNTNYKSTKTQNSHHSGQQNQSYQQNKQETQSRSRAHELEESKLPSKLNKHDKERLKKAKEKGPNKSSKGDKDKEHTLNTAAHYYYQKH